jgi:HAD domain in Swiss Army Knife RNA repair proteins
MKVLFLDIDGVVNCVTTPTRFDNFIGIDPYMAILVNRIIEATNCSVVLSSSWRYHKESMDEVRRRVCDFIDVTPMNNGLTSRGTEIKAWLEAHPDVTQYAILDDNTDFLEGQPLFKTSWDLGLTGEIVEKVIHHLNA